MATTGNGFFKFTAGASVLMMAKPTASLNDAIAALSGTRLDQWSANLSVGQYTKTGATRFALSGTTPKAILLTNTTTGADSYAGDTVFASFMTLILYNDSTAAVVVTPSASNGASLGFTSLTVPAGGTHILNYPVAGVVDGTHYSIDITPGATGSIVLCIGGG